MKNIDSILHENVCGTGRKLSAVEAAAYMGISRSWLDKTRLHGGGPAYLKVGRRVVYDVVELERWLSTRARAHTSQGA